MTNDKSIFVLMANEIRPWIKLTKFSNFEYNMDKVENFSLGDLE